MPQLCQETNTWRPNMDGLDFACIEEDERHALEREFTKEEVTQVLREIKPPVLMDSLWPSFTNVGV